MAQRLTPQGLFVGLIVDPPKEKPVVSEEKAEPVKPVVKEPVKKSVPKK